MTSYAYHTVDVFTSQRFGGNPLAVFPNARGLDTVAMQELATEMNYNETTFVLPPDDPAHTARVRIFNRTSEMPFAGHPNVGTGFVLSRLGLARGPVLRFEELAGVVEVRIAADGLVEIDAPQPLELRGEVPANLVAASVSLAPAAVIESQHKPVRATVGFELVLAEVEEQSLAHASPDIEAMRRLARAIPDLGEQVVVFVYARVGTDIRARMFAPLGGTWEDPATGGANLALAALRLSLQGGESLSYRAIQGVEMGRRSELHMRAWRADDGIRASVGGHCVPVFSGTVAI